MAANGSSTYNNSTSGFIDVYLSDSTVASAIDDYIWYSDSAITSERYSFDMDLIRRYGNENPKIPTKVLRSVKTKVRLFGSKQSRNVKNVKQFTGHKFRIGSSKK